MAEPKPEPEPPAPDVHGQMVEMTEEEFLNYVKQAIADVQGGMPLDEALLRACDAFESHHTFTYHRVEKEEK